MTGLSVLKKIVLPAGFMLAGGILSFFLRYEQTFDFLNYHYYNGFAFLNGRVGVDVAPAGVNTYFNPLLDVVTYVLVNAFNAAPGAYALSRGLPFGALMYVLYRLARTLSLNNVQAAAALAVSATGFATWFQIGTATNETETALLILASLLILAETFPDVSIKRAFFSALLSGMAAGLKMTAGVYCVASAAALVLFCKKLKRPAFALGVFAAGGLAGFLITNGFWMALMTRLYANPFFPFLNGVFHSPYGESDTYSFRALFAGRSLFETVFLPFYMAGHARFSYLGNIVFSDFRFAVAMVALLAYAVKTVLSGANDKTAFCVVWGAVAYVAWLECFSVVRYLIPVETLACVLMTKGFFYFRPQKGSLKEVFYAAAGVVLSFAFLMTPFQSDAWGHRRGFEKVFETPDVVLPPNAVLMLINAPNAAYGAALARKTPSVRLVGKTISEEKSNPWYFTQNTKFSADMRAIVEETPSEKLFYWISSPMPALLRPDKTVCREYGMVYSSRRDKKRVDKEAFLTERGGAKGFHLICAPVGEKEKLSNANGFVLDENTPVFEGGFL